ncbi:MAG TPA: Calx-beta domain-containing protein [Thermoanaerobaculia bacterium]|nr:Calx-beta domain-containing protein [Thermoanaerobaculia bacterium]
MLTPLPEIGATVRVAGSTQPGSYSIAPHIELNASAMTGPGAVVTVQGSLEYVTINRFTGTGIEARGAADVFGCSIGLNAAGTGVAGGGAIGILVSNATAPGVTIGGVTCITGNDIGVKVTSGPATIRSTWIGVSERGSAIPGTPTSRGILITGVHNQPVQIGHGTSPSIYENGQVNYIVGQRIGIEEVDSDHVTYVGTALGEALSGLFSANTEADIHLLDSNDNTITYNAISDSPIGVWVDGSSARNLIRDNQMSATKKISLTGSGNQLQPAPVVVTAFNTNIGTTLNGALHAAPSKTYTIDVYKLIQPPNWSYSGQFTVLTDATGSATFQYALPTGVVIGTSLAATATDASNDTSEFSPPAVVTGQDGFALASPIQTFPDFSAQSWSYDESSGQATVKVLRLYGAATTASVSYKTVDDTAKAGIDYGAVSGTLTFAPGETEKLVTIPLVNDSLAQAWRTFFLTIFSPTNGTIIYGYSEFTVGINEDDPLRLSVGDASLHKPVSGSQLMLFKVTFDVPLPEEYDIGFETRDLSAVAGTDYVAAKGSVSGWPGDTSVFIYVPIIGNATSGPDKTFQLVLSNAVCVSCPGGLFVTPVITRAIAIGTIVGDRAVPTLQSSKIAAGTKGHMTMTFASPTAQSGSVTLASSAPNVATVVSTVPVAAGVTNVAIEVTGVAAGNTAITATLSASLGGATATGNLEVYTPVTLAAQPPYLTIAEGSTVAVHVTMTPPPGSPITLNVAASNTNSLKLPVTVAIDADGNGTITAEGLAIGSGAYTVLLPDANGGFGVSFGYEVTASVPASRKRAVHH